MVGTIAGWPLSNLSSSAAQHQGSGQAGSVFKAVVWCRHVLGLLHVRVSMTVYSVYAVYQPLRVSARACTPTAAVVKGCATTTPEEFGAGNGFGDPIWDSTIFT